VNGIEDIKKLFYNPDTDSLRDTLRISNKIHEKVLEKTDFSKSIVPVESFNYLDLVKDLKLPQKIQSEDKAVKLITELFDGAVRWHSPRTMYNVTPPPLLYTIASNFLVSLYNPNLVWDMPAGKMASAEQRVIKQLTEYIGWDWKQAGGAFVFGGKATSLYAAKIGLRKALPDSQAEGVKKDVILISTKACHPSHISDGEWLGIGAKNVVRLNTHQDSTLDLVELKQTMQDAATNDKKIAAILISGGTTNNMAVDPIKEVVEIRDQIIKRNKLDYSPHVHVDAVVGWPWIFFKNYSFEKNPLNLSKGVKDKFKIIVSNLRHIDLADSFGLDFHKTGFCPYTSSLFLIRNKQEFYKSKDNFVEYGQYTPFAYTLENSRQANGAVAAYVALNTLGVEGFQIILSTLTEAADKLRIALEMTSQFSIINKNGLSNAIIFVPELPGHVNFVDSAVEKEARDNYTTEFLQQLKQRGNPFLLDMTPAYSTGSEVYPYKALKAYLMSPFVNDITSGEFISVLLGIKKQIDMTFDFKTGGTKASKVEYIHPLKDST